jgi:long-chain fatty acid transport protein
MNRTVRAVFPVIMAGVLAGSVASRLDASAFAVNEMSARAMGMGGAFIAIADDSSALFYNPAGIAFQTKTNAQMEALAVNGQFRFFPTDPPPGTVVPEKGFSGSTGTPFIPVASMYMNKRLNEKVAVGFAMFTPNGLATNFENFNDGDPANTKFSGRWAGSRAKLEQYWFTPTVAYRVTPDLAIGVGIAFVHTHIFLQQSFFNPNDDKPTGLSLELAKQIFPGADPYQAYASFARLLPEGRLRAAATANKYGATAGLLYKNRAKKFNIGLDYRSHVVSHLDGKASFSFGKNAPVLPFLPKDRNLDVLFPNQPIGGTFTTPGLYGIGFAKHEFFGGTIAADVKVQDFSRFQDFPINFKVNKDAKGRPTATDPERRLVFNFRNSVLVSLGYEHPMPAMPIGGKLGGMLAKLGKDTTIRAGYMFDRSPVPEASIGPLFPDTSRNSITTGMTKKHGSLDLSAYYQAMFFTRVTTNALGNEAQGTNGLYKNYANLIGLGMRWRVGGHEGKLD